jgi:hypothetical protein
MCGCTLYDSPTCGHSWISMSQPCGFLSDLLSCPYRQTYQTLIAPPYTCPTCHRGFADRETIEMVQGPWGCNQLIRSHVGGNYAIPGQWGNAPLISNGWGGNPNLTSGAMVSMNGMVPMNGYRYDHRLTGSYPPPPPMTCNLATTFTTTLTIDSCTIWILATGDGGNTRALDTTNTAGRASRQRTVMSCRCAACNQKKI